MENYNYLFSFGDAHPSVNTSNNSVVHSYSMSGSYKPSVTIQGFDIKIYFETVVVIQGRNKDSMCLIYVL